MDFCFNCGRKTDPDWVFCRSCGSALDENGAEAGADATAGGIPAAGGTPKVELISRGWDDVVETVETPADPLADDEISPGPLPPGTIEVTVDDVTVVATDEEPEPSIGEEELPAAAEEPEPPVDPWDHLRPHGEMPPLQRKVGIAGRLSQVLVLLTAVAALGAAGIHFFLNTRLDAFRNGRVSARALDDVEVVADASLLVVAALIVLAVVPLAWWTIRAFSGTELRVGKAGALAVFSFVAGVGVAATAFSIKKDTVTEALAANSLIVLGLGLLITACLATVRTISRIERKEPV